MPLISPLLVLMDGTWADAGDWSRRLDRVDAALSDAALDARQAAVVVLTDIPAGDIPFRAADAVRAEVAGLSPSPWQPDPAAFDDLLARLPGAFETFWVSDGVGPEWRAERMPQRLLRLDDEHVELIAQHRAGPAELLAGMVEHLFGHVEPRGKLPGKALPERIV